MRTVTCADIVLFHVISLSNLTVKQDLLRAVRTHGKKLSQGVVLTSRGLRNAHRGKAAMLSTEMIVTRYNCTKLFRKGGIK